MLFATVKVQTNPLSYCHTRIRTLNMRSLATVHIYVLIRHEIGIHNERLTPSRNFVPNFLLMTGMRDRVSCCTSGFTDSLPHREPANRGFMCRE
jgi:hypothetical protein